jgi:4'-phosphopantetheinyl transferase
MTSVSGGSGALEALPEGELHVWTTCEEELSDPALLAAYQGLLTPEETARQQRFRFEKHQHQQLVTRALARSVLSLYTGVDPAAWRFEAGEYGKPDVVEPEGFDWLRFNLSNTDGLIACAVARGCEVGVDVENMQRRGETVKIADRFFADSECAALHRLPESEQRDRFFRYWTLKESYIKARGLGLKIPLEQFAFDVESRPIRIAFDERLGDDAGAWQFDQWRLSDRHMLAVGVQRGEAADLDVRVRSIVPLRYPDEAGR